MNTETVDAVEFTDAEKAYLGEQRLARVATVSPAGSVDVSPVGLHFDGQRFVVVGMNLPGTFRWKNVQSNPSVSLVVDDLASVEPWRPRGIKIHGRGEIGKTDHGHDAIFVIPERKWSWGLA
jgi:pyridoxamine 5'-phosphate oxidase family protein